MAEIEEDSDGEEKLQEEREGPLGDSVVERILPMGSLGTTSCLRSSVTSLVLNFPSLASLESSDDEDDVWGGGGLRGFVQKAEEPWKISRQYFPSKAGGTPAWLDPTNLPRGESTTCGNCSKPLQFVLQVYAAPEDDDASAFHRTLFVFICTSLPCLQEDVRQQSTKLVRRRSVKVFRSQLPRENPFYSLSAPRTDGRELPLSQGVPVCSWCGTWRGDKTCNGCKQTRYCSKRHQVDHWRGDHASYCRRIQEQLESASFETGKISVKTTTPISVGGTPSVAHASALWPEFELIVVDDDLDGHTDSSIASRAQTRKALVDYDRRKRQGRTLSAKDVRGVKEASKEEQHWAFFQTKISKAPEQVLWYLRSAEAKPLWLHRDGQPEEFEIPVCSLCGGERTFEFQILPQLLYFFRVENDPNSLDWGSIAVYSCARSCKIQGYCEEFAWVQPGFT